MGLSISVIIPVYNSAAHLQSCLEHLARSSTAPLECVVVDDGSTDDSAGVARAAGASVLSLKGPGGPARARNAGARIAKGDLLFFLDADVCVYPDTLSLVLNAFEEDQKLDALIGSYDDSPESQDFLSQYKNLMHCFVHQHARRQACTFWSGCGAIRRSVFLEHAGFDESYGRPAIEDIELGYRLRMAGRKVVLDKRVLVRHLKRWTFWNLLKTDILDRGIPWTELILRDRHMPNDLNLELSQRVSVALAFLLVAFTAAAAIFWGGYFFTPLLAVVLFVLARYYVEPASPGPSRTALLFLTLAIGAVVWLAYAHRMKGVLPPLLLGYLLLFLRHRYAYATERFRRLSGLALAMYILAALAYMLSHLPSHMLVFAVFVVAAGIVVVNTQFYLFLAAKRGQLFAMAAVPFHLLYHLYNGISFGVGLVRYTWRNLTRKITQPAPVPTQEQGEEGT
jgi:glycosyltransferase involved in cell wall biosynthesis